MTQISVNLKFQQTYTPLPDQTAWQAELSQTSLPSSTTCNSYFFESKMTLHALIPRSRILREITIDRI